MSAKGITHLIVNSPYDEPKHHWHYQRETLTFSLKDGRRPAGYVIASESSKAFDDPGRFIPIELVNQIRPRVEAWRERDGGYAGVSGITRRLLEHWRGSERYERTRFFFCQLEAIETLIWLTETPVSLSRSKNPTPKNLNQCLTATNPSAPRRTCCRGSPASPWCRQTARTSIYAWRIPPGKLKPLTNWITTRQWQPGRRTTRNASGLTTDTRR